MSTLPTLSALVIAAHGRQFRVRLQEGEAEGEEWLCRARGKKGGVVCGDQVRVCGTGKREGMIEAIEARRNLLCRSNITRRKLIVANVDQILLMAACEPLPSRDLVFRCLIAAAAEGIIPLVVLNKCDLTDKLIAARQRLMPLLRLGQPLLELSARGDIRILRPHLAGKTSVLVGQSGVGKSTLINALIPGANTATREISTALGGGKHTTTAARLYDLDSASHIIDSPGLQEFGLRHLSRAALERAFPEFAPYLGHCRFRDCRHRQEPGCALVQALREKRISRERFLLFHTLAEESETRPSPASPAEGNLSREH
jgi:ribosome biogenesis GTPase